MKADIGPILLSYLLSYFIVKILLRAEPHFKVMDIPNDRSMHKIPVPRTGGVGIMVSIITCAAFVLFQEDSIQESGRLIIWLVSFTVLFCVSLADDVRGLSSASRLIVHIACAAAVTYDGSLVPIALDDSSNFSVLAYIVTVLYIVWMINLYNFMDGMDGLASGMAIIGFTALGIFGYQGGEIYFSMLCFIVAASSAGFLVLNFPPAKIFMGDVGSSTMGFLAALFSLWAHNHNVVPIWITLLVFSPFIVDSTMTLMRRAVNGEVIWSAHRSHFYQRLVQLGWSHRKTLLWEYALMLLCVGSALAINNRSLIVQSIAIFVIIIIYLTISLAVSLLEVKERRRQRE